MRGLITLDILVAALGDSANTPATWKTSTNGTHDCDTCTCRMYVVTVIADLMIGEVVLFCLVLDVLTKMREACVGWFACGMSDLCSVMWTVNICCSVMRNTAAGGWSNWAVYMISETVHWLIFHCCGFRNDDAWTTMPNLDHDHGGSDAWSGHIGYSCGCTTGWYYICDLVNVHEWQTRLWYMHLQYVRWYLDCWLDDWRGCFV